MGGRGGGGSTQDVVARDVAVDLCTHGWWVVVHGEFWKMEDGRMVSFLVLLVCRSCRVFFVTLCESW